MRKPMMAGNWKMNMTISEAADLASAIVAQTNEINSVDRVICPTYVCLPAVSEVLNGANVALGAQNMHFAESGAYTGEISAAMLQGLVEYVIIGHSERRQYFGETDETVNKKIVAALAAGLKPIVCVGESLEQNQAGETQTFVSGQVNGEQVWGGLGLADLSAEQVANLIIAYEPIWAIGTGLAATSQQAQDICGGVVRAIEKGPDRVNVNTLSGPFSIVLLYPLLCLLQNLAQEELGSLVFRVGKENFWRGLLHDFAVVEHADAVGNGPGKAHLMGDDQHGHTAFG